MDLIDQKNKIHENMLAKKNMFYQIVFWLDTGTGNYVYVAELMNREFMFYLTYTVGVLGAWPPSDYYTGLTVPLMNYTINTVQLPDDFDSSTLATYIIAMYPGYMDWTLFIQEKVALGYSEKLSVGMLVDQLVENHFEEYRYDYVLVKEGDRINRDMDVEDWTSDFIPVPGYRSVIVNNIFMNIPLKAFVAQDITAWFWYTYPQYAQKFVCCYGMNNIWGARQMEPFYLCTIGKTQYKTGIEYVSTTLPQNITRILYMEYVNRYGTLMAGKYAMDLVGVDRPVVYVTNETPDSNYRGTEYETPLPWERQGKVPLLGWHQLSEDMKMKLRGINTSTFESTDPTWFTALESTFGSGLHILSTAQTFTWGA
ncbi:MAG: hypothetical protein H7836_16080 [Magnetococcus sp. YQC-3]